MTAKKGLAFLAFGPAALLAAILLLAPTETTAQLSRVIVRLGATVVRPGGVLNVNVTPVSNVSTTETDLMTYTLPANTMAVNGQGIRVSAYGTTAANGNSKTARLYFGASVVAIQAAITSSGSAWHATMIVLRTGAATQAAGGNIWTALNTGNPASPFPAETLSGPIVIKATGQSGTGSNDITQTGMVVEALP